MSTDKKPSYIDSKLAAFTDRVEAALEKERQERKEERKEYEAKREKERKEYEAKLEKERKDRIAERKEHDAKREKERKEYEAKREKERKEERKEYEAKREKERKEYEAKREKERKEYRREVAVEAGKLSDMWGKLAEFVIASGILELLNRHGDFNLNDTLPDIKVRCQDEQGKFENGQIDIIVSGERDLVIVETKTTLEASDVNHFLKKYLRDYDRWQPVSQHITLPSSAGRRIFGCMAYMKADDGAEDAAVREGLLTVHAFGDSCDIAHPDTVLVDYHPDRQARP